MATRMLRKRLSKVDGERNLIEVLTNIKEENKITLSGGDLRIEEISMDGEDVLYIFSEQAIEEIEQEIINTPDEY